MATFTCAAPGTAPFCSGTSILLGGEMAFRGNNFTLTRGDINFANPFQLDPELNVEATSIISQYQVTINFSGRASKLSLSYRSDPPLPDTDIIALLALGSTGRRKRAALPIRRVANYGATACFPKRFPAASAAASSISSASAIFVWIRFLPARPLNPNAAARVTIEQQITRDFTVTYSSNAAVRPGSAHSGGIPREARPLGDLSPRYQRHLRPRSEIREALSLKIYFIGFTSLRHRK